MSHIVTLRTEARDPTTIAAACRRLSLSERVRGTAKLFSAEAAGLAVDPRDRVHPVVCHVK